MSNDVWDIKTDKHGYMQHCDFYLRSSNTAEYFSEVKHGEVYVINVLCHAVKGT